MGNRRPNKQPLHDFEKINEFIYFYKPESQPEAAVPSLLSSSASSSSASFTNVAPSPLQSTANGSLKNSVTNRKSYANAKDPSLIIYCAWASALPRHVTKYTAAYKNQFPPSAILLILSPAWTMIIPRARHARLLRPAAAIIRSTMPEQEWETDEHLIDKVTRNERKKKNIYDGVHAGNSNDSTEDRPIAKNDNSNMLLHTVSNGGAMAVVALAASLGRALPVSAVIFDCGPGNATTLSSANGIFATLPARWQNLLKGSLIRRLIGRLVWSSLFCLFSLLYTLRSLFRRRNIAVVVREKLNDGTVLPKDARRCYLYGVEDELVAWKDVERHADDAETKGCGGYGIDSAGRGRAIGIRRVKFGPGAKHAALSLSDGERYWKAVERTWRGYDDHNNT